MPTSSWFVIQINTFNLSSHYIYNAGGRLISYNGEEVRYDADGNMTYGPINGVMGELTYDCRNRLVSAGGINYTYDAENNRIAMQSERHSETYVVDTVSASLSQILTITDGNGTETLCIYGNGLICEKTGDIYAYHHYNNLGSTVKLTDADGRITASFTYGTYGELLSGSTGSTRFLYNGRCGVITDENGLYYMRQRYYSPELKRFANQDIIAGNLDDSQSLNRYSYVQGNPVSYTDPFGLSPLSGLFTGNTLWHGVLGLLGMVPGFVGTIANAIDAIVYLCEGDYFGAALSFTNAVSMGATATATRLLKAGKLGKATCTAMKVAMISERIAGGLSFAQNTYNVGMAGIQMYCKYGILEESFGLDTAGEVLGIGLSLMGAKGGLSRMGSNSADVMALRDAVGTLCFVAGTKVRTADGDKNIEDIEAGDEVWSCDTETGETGVKHVTRLFVNEAVDIAHVTIDGETIDSTDTHPFYVEGYGFKPAGQLLAGEKVRLLDGGTGEVEEVTVEHLEEPVKVYNFEVEDWHTYYVADTGVLVHNKGCGTAKTLYHYTNEKGMNGIVESKQLNPSLKANNPKDARYGDGQYLSDIKPNTQTPAGLARKFIHVPNKYKYTHYVEIDVTNLEVIEGREGVFVIPNSSPLDLTDRIISAGEVGMQ